MPEMNVVGWSDLPSFYAQRTIELQFFAQLRLADDLRAALFKKCEGLVQLHKRRAATGGRLIYSCSATRAPDRSSLACRVG